MPFCPEKGQKGAKVGGAVGKNKLFCILYSKLSHYIFLIFCMELETINGAQLYVQNRFQIAIRLNGGPHSPHGNVGVPFLIIYEHITRGNVGVPFLIIYQHSTRGNMVVPFLII